jgi:DNA polymerase-1
MHNGVFDYQMTKGSIGVDTENSVCTQLGEYTLTVGKQFDGYSLANITLKYLKKERDKSLQKSFIGHKGDFTQAQLDYSAEDAYDLLDLAKIMQKQAIEDGVMKTWMIENGALPAFGDIEFYGQKIDADKWKDIMRQNKEKEKQAKIDLDKWFIPIVGTDLFGFMGLDSDSQGAAINYNSVPEVLHALQRMGIKVDGETIQNTDKKSQNKNRDHGAIRALMNYRNAVKLYGTYGQTYIKAIHPITGRVHFKLNQYGAGTGRPTARNKLNCLNIPRDKRYRQAFGTDQGRLISTVDYSAAELRILAELSGDKLMVDGFNAGVDFHCFVASMIFNKEVTKTNENKLWRDPVKTLNFGKVNHSSRNKIYSIQGNPTAEAGAILSESAGNSGSVQRLTAQTDRLWTGYAAA